MYLVYVFWWRKVRDSRPRCECADSSLRIDRPANLKDTLGHLGACTHTVVTVSTGDIAERGPRWSLRGPTGGPKTWLSLVETLDIQSGGTFAIRRVSNWSDSRWSERNSGEKTSTFSASCTQRSGTLCTSAASYILSALYHQGEIDESATP